MVISYASHSAIENGANFLAEGFLFAVATALILGETWRSSRSSSKRRDDVDEKLEDLQSKMQDVTKWMEGAEERYVEEQRKYVSILGPYSSYSSLHPFDDSCLQPQVYR